ncbi:MAG: hypothetical protein AAFN30_05765 [Actinomycetota bacterium]
MTAPEHTRPDTDDDLEEANRPRPRTLVGNIGRGLAITVVAGSFLVWIYAYSGAADRDAPDLLADATFGQRAEAVCAAAAVDIEAMPNALDAVDGPDRGRQIEATTARYEVMLDELDTLVRGDARDVEIASGWLADWRVMIQDRYRYAEAIAADDQAQFYVSDVGVAERLDRRLTRLANTNAMPSCGAPTDLG